MTAGAIPRLSPMQRRIAGVIAATLRIPVDIIWPDEPLAGLGMDSLGAVERRRRSRTSWASSFR